MKKNFYQHIVTVTEDAYLYYNAFSDNYLLLNHRLHSIYQNNTPEKIKEINPSLYETLIQNRFIIEDNVDEFSITEYKKLQKKYDSTLYHIVINTTLDCNLKCWYCYESKIKDSILKEDIIDSIKKNIRLKFELAPYKELKISFFGGEPFLNFKCIQEVLDFAQEFTQKHKIDLVADFTTNATLITKEQLLYLSNFKCCFQITLDGYREKHNTIRFFKENKIGTYNDIIHNIHRIHNSIPESYIWIRINFDNQTLNHFSDILKDLEDLNRKKTFLILRRVWQLPKDSVGKDILLESLQNSLDAGFFIDYYTLSRNELCFAERENQVLINYDGRVFKCSTIECFDEKHSYGTLQPNGEISWNINALAQKVKYISGEECKNCKLYPACLGRCSQKKSKKQAIECYLETTNLSIDEFIMYNYKLKNLWLSKF